MKTSYEVHGLDELMARFRQFPEKYSKAVAKTLQAGLLILQGAVPAYPRPPAGSKYRRTGLLGRSLGSSETGSKMGKADISETVKAHGYQEAHFGTRLKYAPHVVGDRSSQQSSRMRRWWTVPQTVLEKALPKINKAFERLGIALAKFLDKGTAP
jgi:hypothetical protein